MKNSEKIEIMITALQMISCVRSTVAEKQSLARQALDSVGIPFNANAEHEAQVLIHPDES